MLPNLSQRANYKWWVFGAIAIGTFLSVVSHVSVIVALPTIAEHFGADLPSVQWVVLGEALAIAVLLLPMGRLGDMVGRQRVYIAGFAVFVAAAALAGLSGWVGLPMLIAAKALQGAGSAMIQGNAVATILATFPGSERGQALGSNLSVVGAGAIIGPALGGLLVSAWGWQAVFWANVPVGIFTIVATIFVLGRGRSPERARDGQRQRFDLTGAILSGATLLFFLLTAGNAHRAGWTSPLIVTGALAFVALLVAFIWWERRVPSPMLDLELFRRKSLALGVVAGWVSFLGTSATRFLMPFYLQRVLGLSPNEIGLALIPPALALVVLGPISGRLSDAFGWRRFTMGGLACSAAAAFIFAAGLSESFPVWLIVATLTLQGSGTGLFHSPNSSAIMSTVDRSEYGVVAGLTNLMRNSANIISITLATTIVVAVMGARGVEPSLDAVSPAVFGAFLAGLRWAFLVMGILLLLGIAVAFLRGDKPREETAPAQRRTRAG